MACSLHSPIINNLSKLVGKQQFTKGNTYKNLYIIYINKLHLRTSKKDYSGILRFALVKNCTACRR